MPPIISRGFRGRRREDAPGDRVPPGQYVTETFRCSPPGRRRIRRSTSGTFTISGEVDGRRALDLGGVPRAAERGGHGRHPLRDEVVEARHALGRASRSTRCSTASTRRRVRGRGRRRRLHDERAARGPHRRQGVGRLRVRRRAARRRSTAARRACSSRTSTSGRAPSGCAGCGCRRRTSPGFWETQRLPQLRRPVAGTAVLGRLTWQVARGRRDVVVGDAARQDASRLDVPDWPGHRAGQHVDVRLTAEDGYQAERSYSIASAPNGTRVELTVECARRRRGLAVPDRRASAGRPDRAARPDRRLLRLGAARSAGRCCSSPAARASCR